MTNYLLAASVILVSWVGSIIGILVKNISHKVNDILVGFSAGIMLAACFLGFLPQSLEVTQGWEVLIPISAIFVGALVVCLFDKYLPHQHFSDGQLVDSEAKSNSGNKVLLIVIALAIHNIPEGLAVGLAIRQGQEGVMMLVSILIQKLPEGLIVALPLLSVGMKKSKVLLYSTVVALMMLPGMLVGLLITSLPPLAVSFFMAFTFGCILYVVSDEMIPESHQHGYQRPATFAMLLGIVAVVLLNIFL